MSRPDIAATYRLRQIPAFVKRAQLPEFLAQNIHSLTVGAVPDNVHVYSFTPTIGDWRRPPLQTATIAFDSVPNILKDGRDEWHFPISGQPTFLILDSHFLDFTSLNKVDDDTHTFDCIAISGLASHPFGSWKYQEGAISYQPEPLNFMWLRDQLPLDLPCMRVLTYGYDTKLAGSHSFQTIDDIALFFIHRLSAIRTASQSRRPLVILAHSLGGIVLKSAMLHLAGSGDYEQSLLKDIRAVIFFGVPSQGMHTSHLLSMVESQPNHQLVERLSEGSDYLFDLNHKLSGVSLYRDIRLISAFETEQSPIVVKTPGGKWATGGKREILVKSESAIQFGTSTEDVFPINKDHSNMVKFSPGDPNYGVVLARLQQVTDSSRLKLPGEQGQEQTSVFEVSAATCFATKQSPSTQDTFGLSEHDLIHEMTESLRFAEIDYRRDEITEAHPGSFDWIFDSETGFVDWLCNQTGYYWIRGKPGSGKSCLMNFLHADGRCKSYLSHWTPSRELVTAWFFFHDRGSLMQKSWEGLLRSVLYQLVKGSPSIGTLLLPYYLRKIQKRLDHIWTLFDLEQCFAKILEQDKFNLDVVLFLDALDEYNDPPELIAEALKGLTEIPKEPAFLGNMRDRNVRTRIKICFSSRPWDIFMKRFRELPGFFIHEKTKNSLRMYITDRLWEIEKGEQGSSTHDTLDLITQATIDKMILKAEGVFLWVKLVLDRIQNQYRPHGTALSKLVEQQIEEFPPKLEDLYTQTLQRISTASRMDAFIILELVYRAPGILYVDDLYFAAGCGGCQTYAQCKREIARLRNLNLSYYEMGTRLKNLCGGLLELVEHRIQFIHRTAKDFVGKPGWRQHMFGRYGQPTAGNGFSTWFKYFLVKFGEAGFRNTSGNNWSAPELLGLAIHAAYESESTIGTHQGQFLDSLPQYLFIEAQKRGYQRTGCESILAFAVIAGLQLYILEKMDTLQMTTLMDCVGGMPILHAAVQWTLFRPSAFEQKERTGTAQAVRLLLEQYPCDTNFEGYTPLELLFSQGFSGTSNSGKDLSFHSRTPIAELADAFLERGVDPNIRMDVTCTENVRMLGERSILASNCTPLHVSRSPVTEVLLKHGADVNARDSAGQTPLDIAYGSGYGSILSDRYADEMIATTKAILDAGGEATTHGFTAFESFAKSLYQRRGTISDELLVPLKPRLFGKLPTRPSQPNRPHLAASRSTQAITIRSHIKQPSQVPQSSSSSPLPHLEEANSPSQPRRKKISEIFSRLRHYRSDSQGNTQS